MSSLCTLFELVLERDLWYTSTPIELIIGEGSDCQLNIDLSLPHLAK